MKLVLFPDHRCVVFEIHAETEVEKALLNHLGSGHDAAVFDGGYRCDEGKLRLVIKNPDPVPPLRRRIRPRKR